MPSLLQVLRQHQASNSSTRMEKWWPKVSTSTGTSLESSMAGAPNTAMRYFESRSIDTFDVLTNIYAVSTTGVTATSGIKLFNKNGKMVA